MSLLRSKPLLLLSSLLFTATLLSAVQIYLRLWLSGGEPILARQVLLNLVAWAPWYLISALALGLLRLVPIRSPEWPRSVLIHLAFALCFSSAFLAYLGVFRLVTQGEELTVASLWLAFGVEVGDFLLVCLILYGLILVVGRRGEVREQLESAQPFSPVESLMPIRFQVRSQGRTRYIAAQDIDWISGEGSYAGLHVGRDLHLLRCSLSELDQRLGASGFVRIHRSTIVNRARVVGKRSLKKGDAELELSCGTLVRMSRRFRMDFGLAGNSGSEISNATELDS